MWEVRSDNWGELNRAKKTASLHQKSKVVQDLRQKKREKKERKSARERERERERENE